MFVLLLLPAAGQLTHCRNCLSLLDKAAGREDQLLVMFWNLENFFDWRRDSLNGSDSEVGFTSFGKRHWTKRRFQAKCNAIAKSILWVKDEEGILPDIIGVAEVENRFVLKRLLEDTQLYRTDYGIVHYDSPDPRGIDVALLYRTSRLTLMQSRPLRVDGGTDHPLLTRDILLTKFLKSDGDSIAFLVNHHPSKYGGKTGQRREVALRRLRDATDSLQKAGLMNIVAMGDFNDTPISYAHHKICSRLTDCYRATANGIGRSFNRDAIYVRIDNIFCSSHFKPFAVRVDDTVPFSDHYPIIGYLKPVKRK